MNFEAAIFDMDGTLIDAYMAWKNIFQGLSKYGYIINDNEFTVLYAMTYHQTIDYLRMKHSDLKLPCNFDDIIRDFDTAAEAEYATAIKAKPHALDYVKAYTSKAFAFALQRLLASGLQSLRYPV